MGKAQTVQDTPGKVGYDRRMTGSPALNTMNAPKWAAVVSGTVWKRWGVSPSGLLEAEYVRGPLIVWAKPGSGEEEDAPKIEAPKPDALALRVVEVNTARQWEKVGQAARWKVRASVRWKTRTGKLRAAYIAFVKGFTPFSPSSWPTVFKSYMLDMKRRRARLAQKPERAAGSYKFSAYWLSMGGTLRNPATVGPAQYFALIKHYFSQVNKTQRFYTVRPSDSWEMSPADLSYTEYFDDDTGEDVADILPSDWDGEEKLVRVSFAEQLHFIPPEKFKAGVCDWLNLTLIDKSVRDLFIRALKQPSALMVFMRSVLALLYLAHARKRAKPAPRRGRVPRPLYARPRPPSAPLAPPVTC